jgi:hypothetical protein
MPSAATNITPFSTVTHCTPVADAPLPLAASRSGRPRS